MATMQGMMESATGSFTNQREGEVARMIEKQTSRIPSDWFLWAAVGAMGASLFLQFKRDGNKSLFVGEWVPTLLIFGLYNKMVKQLGSDRLSRVGENVH